MVNPLRQVAVSTYTRTGKTAREWAQIARDKGDAEAAVMWEKADLNRWDDEHFDPAVRDQHNRDAAAWAGKRGLITNRT